MDFLAASSGFSLGFSSDLPLLLYSALTTGRYDTKASASTDGGSNSRLVNFADARERKEKSHILCIPDIAIKVAGKE